MNLWMSCFIKQRSLVFRGLLNPPVATLRLVSVIISFFFQVEILRWKKRLKYTHCTQCRATVDLGFIWLHRFFSQREFYMSFLFDCLEWSTTPKKNLLFFFSSFPLKEKKEKKKFNLDSANTLVTSKAVKRKKEQIIRRWWELAHSPVEGKRGTE